MTALTNPLRRTAGNTVLFVLAVSGCAAPDAEALPEGFQAISVRGDTLVTPAIDESVRTVYEANLEDARRAWENSPDNADSIIWYGRRTAYLGLYRQAIEIFSQGIESHPDDARLYRHRGHRYLTTRQFELAAADFEHAARLFEGQPDRIEPDGLPNALNVPTSTLQGNVWYHLGLARFLMRDWAAAAEAYRRGMELENTEDMRVAFANWYYVTLMRLGLDETADAVVAGVTPQTELIENTSYQRMILLYRGILPVDSLIAPQEDALAGATTMYGVGNWYLMNGDTASAIEVYQSALQSSSWAAFGYLGAESELRALGL